LTDANLQGARFFFARLDHARLNRARLQGANLNGANLQGADLVGAQFQGADLGIAKLQGVSLILAQLQGASLFAAELQGANLFGADLLGANLKFAQLQGAVLTEAQLQCVDLSQAQLQGADLSRAQLQGAELEGTEVGDVIFNETLVFRTDISFARNLPKAAIRSVQADAVTRNDLTSRDLRPLSPADIDKWEAAATEFASEDNRASISERFTRVKLGFQTAQQDAADESDWSVYGEDLPTLDPEGAKHRNRLATMLGDLACEADGRPYVARGLLQRIPALGDQLDAVRNRMNEGRQNPERCPGVAGFTEKDWHDLRAMEPAQPTPGGDERGLWREPPSKGAHP
jgi:uncharacterized protein YjbI with pentapeptide repeats